MTPTRTNYFAAARITGSTTRDGCSFDRCTVFRATRVSASARNGRPVFGFASNRGEFDDDTAIRIRCPLLNTSDVLHRSTDNSYTFPASRNASFTFMWPFVDKLLGLGFATPSERAWVNGGQPSQGFLKGVTGPFADVFHPMASGVSDWLFMAGLFGIGLAMLLGAGLKVAAWSGTLLLAFMYLAEFPWGQPADFHATNPIVDSHWHEAALLLVAAYSLAGDTWGLGKWWSRKVGNSWLR